MTEFNSKEEAAPRRFFFRKGNRLLKRADFLRVYDQGRAYRRSLVHVFVLKEEAVDGALPPTRLGITATRKSGKSVYRNRGRRLVREAYRLMLPELEPGYSLVVNVMRAATQSKLAPVDAQLREVLRQAGVLKTPAPTAGLPEPATPAEPPQ